MNSYESVVKVDIEPMHGKFLDTIRQAWENRREDQRFAIAVFLSWYLSPDGSLPCSAKDLGYGFEKNKSFLKRSGIINSKSQAAVFINDFGVGTTATFKRNISAKKYQSIFNREPSYLSASKDPSFALTYAEALFLENHEDLPLFPTEIYEILPADKKGLVEFHRPFDNLLSE